MAVFRITVTMSGHFPHAHGVIWGDATQSLFFTATSEEISRHGPEFLGAVKAACATYGMSTDTVANVYIGEVFLEEISSWLAAVRRRKTIESDLLQRSKGVFLVTLQGPSPVGYSEVFNLGEGRLSLAEYIDATFGCIAARGNKCKPEESHLQFTELSKEELLLLLSHARPEELLTEDMDRFTEETGHLPRISTHDWDEGCRFWAEGLTCFRTCPKPEDFYPGDGE